MRYQEALQVAEELLKDAEVGEEVSFGDDDDATPHSNANRPDKGEHVDGWKAVKRADGSIKVDKKWA